MLEMPSLLAKKLILNLNRNEYSKSDIDILNITQGILYDILKSQYGFEADWNTFSRGGQYETEDSIIKAQIASIQKLDDQDNNTIWAIRLRIREALNKRRNWILNIAIRQESTDAVTLYYAQSYYDYLAGSFAAPKPLMIEQDTFAEAFMRSGQLLCMCGMYRLPAAAIELTHANLPDFIDVLHDEKRVLPIVLISCPDILHPDDLYAIVRGNLIVYWFTDYSVLVRLNEVLSPEHRPDWDCVHILMPTANIGSYSPTFSSTDIERMGADALISGVYQAFCASLRSDDRRGFFTFDDVVRLRDNRYQATIRARLADAEEKAQSLSSAVQNTVSENETLKKRIEDLESTRKQSGTDEYEALLDEALSETDALKAGISSLSTLLYSDMGKTFKPDACESNAHIQELAHAIYACLARANNRK